MNAKYFGISLAKIQIGMQSNLEIQIWIRDDIFWAWQSLRSPSDLVLTCVTYWQFFSTKAVHNIYIIPKTLFAQYLQQILKQH